MVTHNTSNPRSGRLIKLFHDCVSGTRPIASSQDAKLFFEAIDVFCLQKSPSVCVESILSSKHGCQAVGSAVRSNVSSAFISSSTMGFLRHLRDPQVKTIDDGSLLTDVMIAILCPPTFWSHLQEAYRETALQQDGLLTFAWLCFEIVSSHSPDLEGLFPDVKSLLEERPLPEYPDESVREMAYKIQKAIRIRASAPSTPSAAKMYSPGGRHDNDFEDFRKISIYPTADEIASTQKPFLQRLDDVFEVPSGDRSRTHLDWLFRLLREDMLGELREELQVAWGEKKAKRKPLSLSKLSILKYDTGDRFARPLTLWISCLQGIHIPRSKTTKEARTKFFEENKNIVKHNSFGALCLDCRVVAFGSVIREVEMLAQDVPAIGIQFTDSQGLKRALTGLLGARRDEFQFFFVDTATFAYQPILQRLQTITGLPVENELLSLQEEPVEGQQVHPKLEKLLFHLRRGLASGNEVDLSHHIPKMRKKISVGGAQLKSLLNGLESPLGQIQGPPGTGKSFIGALLILILLELTPSRILVLSYTNHALDQFLEDLMDIGIDSKTMVRLGSKGTTRTEPLKIDRKNKETKHRFSHNIRLMLDLAKSDHAGAEDLLDEAMSKLQHSVSDTEILEMLEFAEQGPHIWQAFQISDDDDGFQVLGKNNRAMTAEDLYDSWRQGKDIYSLGHVRHFMEPKPRAVWDIPPAQRLQLHQGWSDQLRQEQINEFVQLAERSNNAHAKIESLFKESKREILRSSRVIGCTTTAAAMFQSIIKSAEPDVVLVEEAGEILEAHVITALSPSVKQLILIGDHKQLRPKVSNYSLTLEGGEGFDLNVSLFERLIRQGHSFTTLQEQHRSHPDISSFARLLAYDELTDNPKTLSRERIRGLSERVVFVHHENPEEQLADVADRRDPSSKASKKNAFEAEMVLRTVKYLSQQGYKSDKMVVLTPYLGQLSLLKQRLSEINDPYLNDLDSHELVRAGLMTPAAAKATKARLRLSTVDNYQGEESDIVIVSMARSNSRGDIGFLIARERLVVLMSRARCGIILFGNMHTFMASKKGGGMWTTYFDALKEKGFLFDGLPVRCEQHPERSVLIKNTKDFDQHCPDGGCAELCDKLLGCGKHKCQLRCHRLPDHSKAKCDIKVPRTCERGHQSKVLCGNEKQGCQDCAREDEETRRRALRDLELEKSRLEREEKYRQQLEEMDDEIEHHRRKMQYSREEEEQKKTIEKKKAELQTLKDMQSRLEAAEESAKRLAEESKAGSAPAKSSNLKKNLSTSAQEWQDMKTTDGAANSALDELMDLIGLESVKAEFLGIKTRVDQKMRMGVSLKKERLSCSLLGNPGTGKTTVARFYGDFLMNVGAIAGNCFKEATGSKLANIGVSGCEKLLEQIKDDGGGVLFIDEAYQLSSGNSPGGKAVLDFLLAEVENLRGKVVFVLAGYVKQMESFFAHNPGFPSRFPTEMKFEDYSDEELRQILEMQVDRKFMGRMKVEGLTDGLFFRIAARRVGRSRGKEGFGNARAVENTLAQIEKRQGNRIRAERRANGKPDDFLLTKEDIIGPEPSMALENSKAWVKLNGMIGIKQVKQQVKTLLDSLKTNYERELEEEPLLQFSLNQVFLGSPGTGKTTVAKLYGQILADLGLLSNGEVVIKTPADFIGAYIGHSEAQTKGILAATVGKVLVIDEAYGLYGGESSAADPFKTAVVDTIVGEVQNVPGDDRCVILIGYKEQMDQMFRNVNPGLSRRFSVDNPFVFEDFDDDGLRQVLEFKMKDSGFKTTVEGLRVALDVLIRERNRPNFGNGGAIENLLSRAKMSYQKRMSTGKIRRNQLDPVDFDEDFERSTRKDTNVRQLFKDDIGREDIIKMLENVQSRVRQMKAIGLDVKEEIPFNFLFRGPPGTGKSTTARKMGKVYYDMGFLSDATVIDCSATDLIGQYVGHTGPKVQAVLDKALGKVLLIDEAYRLAGDGHFAKEAIDELVDCLTKPKYQGKLIVILAGYDKDINRLLSVNPGLSSRFPETLNFEPLSPENCFELLVSLLQQRKRELSRKGTELDLSCMESPSRGFQDMVVGSLEQLSALEGWASARDVKTLARNIFRAVDLDAKVLKLEESKALNEVAKMHHERRGRLNTGSPPPSGMDLPLRATPRPRSNMPPQITTSTSTRADLDEAQDDDADDQPDQEPVVDMEKVDGRRSRRVVRDAGVSDEAWEQLQRDKEEEQRREDEYRKLVEAGKKAQGDARDKIIKQLIEEERLRKLEAAKKAKLEAMGVCPAGFAWIKQESGYRCEPGGHFVSDADLC